MKNLIFGVLSAIAALAVAQGDCPETKQVKCVDDVRAAYDPCKKAAQSGGANLPATIQCMKYYQKANADCWPCICDIARMDKVHIQGCDQDHLIKMH